MATGAATPSAAASPTVVPAPSLSPSLTPSPTATAAPPVPAATRTPSALPPLLPDRRELGETALGYVRQLAETIGIRQSASQQELAAARFIQQELAAMGYQATLQPFTFTARPVRGPGQPQEMESRNVVAVKPGDPSRVLVLGGHYDTTPNGPGANDNASGTATLLAIARALRDVELGMEVRFVAFGSEEMGLFGSRHYVRSLKFGESERIVAMLNFDALATGEKLLLSGDALLGRRALTLARDLGVSLDRSPDLEGSTSDHFAFQLAGVRAIIFWAADLSRIHTPQDTLAFVRPELLGDAAWVGLNLVLQLATQQPTITMTTAPAPMVYTVPGACKEERTAAYRAVRGVSFKVQRHREVLSRER